MEPAVAVLLLGVVLVVLALVFYLVSVILELRKITAGLDAVIGAVGGIVTKSEPVNGVVVAINKDLSAGTDLLEGLLDKKAGQEDAAGLIESVYPGAGASVLERQGRTGEVKNIDDVYTRGRCSSSGSGARAHWVGPHVGPRGARRAVLERRRPRPLPPASGPDRRPAEGAEGPTALADDRCRRPRQKDG